MVNTAKKFVNLEEYTSINENGIVVETQEKLKTGQVFDEMLLDIVKMTVKCDFENKKSSSIVCNVIKKHKINSNEWKVFDQYDKYACEKEFIDLVKSNEDFIKAYFLEEEKNTIWLIINDFAFKYKKVYLQKARDFKESNDCDFDVFIFDKKQILNVEKQLNFMGDYKVISKDAE